MRGLKYIPMILSLLFLCYIILPKNLRPKELLRQKHDFSQEILACSENKAVTRIIEGNIMEVGRARYSGQPILGLKPSSVHKYDETYGDLDRHLKTKFALDLGNDFRPKVKSPVLVCFGKDGILSKHFAP